MIDDLLYKLARKSLGKGLYAAISRSGFGRARQWVSPATYEAVFAWYRERVGDPRGKIVCELGSGFQYYTAIQFVAAGAERVVLAEPKSRGSSPAEAAERLAQDHAALGATGASLPAAGEVAARVSMLPGLEAVGADLDGQVDILCSHLVLEHVGDLDSVFRHTARLLSPGGRALHRVDCSDHTYHVLGKYPALLGFATRRSLQHLRYSDRLFALVNDPKCWMNRKVLPEFLAAARRNGLAAEYRIAHRVENPRLHRDVLARFGADERDQIGAVDFSLELRRA